MHLAANAVADELPDDPVAELGDMLLDRVGDIPHPVADDRLFNPFVEGRFGFPKQLFVLLGGIAYDKGIGVVPMESVAVSPDVNADDIAVF